jgi:LacI family transcriptional regulator
MSTVIAGMEKIANIHGYNLIISQSQESAKREIASVNTMFNSRVDGLMVSLAFETENIEHFNSLLQKNIPIIFFDRIVEHTKCTNIVIDNVKAGYDITSHLIEQGCRRIVYIGGSLTRNVYIDRLRGYKQALAEKGISFDDSLVIVNSLNEQAGSEAAQQVLKMSILPDGIFAANDTSAVACMQELKQAGIKIPTQIAVAGFNNDPISRVIEPNLTTVHYPGLEMGEVAATTLINGLNKMSATNLNTLVLRHNLIIRQSTLRKS